MEEQNHSKPLQIQTILGKLFPSLGKTNLYKLEEFVRRNKLEKAFNGFYEDPEKRYRNTLINFEDRRVFKLLRRVGITDYRIYISEEQALVGRPVESDREEYCWLFTPKNIDISLLSGASDKMNPLEKTLEEIDTYVIGDQIVANRIRMIRGRLLSSEDMTDEQMRRMRGATMRTVRAALKGTNYLGKKIGATDIMPMFNAELDKIGLGLKNNEVVYTPNEPPREKTAEDLRKETDEVQKILSLKNESPIKIKNPVTTVVPKAYTKTVTIIEEHIEKPTKKVHKARKHIEPEAIKPRTVSKRRSEQTAQLIEKMFPSLLETDNVSEQAGSQMQEIPMIKINASDEKTKKVGLEILIQLPAYIYPKLASIYGTSVEVFRKTYEEKMKVYACKSKGCVSILQSPSFYQVAKLMAEFGLKKPKNDLELSEAIMTSYGKKVSSDTVKKSIKPFIEIGLVQLDYGRYKMNENFSKNSN